MKATDADSGSFGKVYYTLYEKYQTLMESQKFYIEKDSGRICVSKDIDREGDLESYELLVKAQDQVGL